MEVQTRHFLLAMFEVLSMVDYAQGFVCGLSRQLSISDRIPLVGFRRGDNVLS